MFGTKKKNDLAWAEACQSGMMKATHILGERYEWPWTMKQLDAGLRSELLDTYYRCMLEDVIAACGQPDDSLRATVMKDATTMAEGMRTRAALHSARARMHDEGIAEPAAIKALLLSAVSAEMGTSQEESYLLAQKYLAAG